MVRLALRVLSVDLGSGDGPATMVMMAHALLWGRGTGEEGELVGEDEDKDEDKDGYEDEDEGEDVRVQVRMKM